MNTTNAEMLLEQLKQKLGDYEISDDDFYASDETAEVEAEEMYGYFTGALREEDQSRIDRLIDQSMLFLSDMIGIGEIVIARTAGEHLDTVSWQTIRNLPKRALSSDRKATSAIRRDALAFSLSNVHLAAADTSGERTYSQSLPCGVDVEVFEDGDNVVVDLNTRDKTFDGQLFGYSLRGDDQTLLGMVMLHLGSSETVSASVEVGRAELVGQYTLNVLPVGPENLGNEDTELIVTALKRDLEDGISAESWNIWHDQIAQTTDNASGLVGLLSSVQAVLAR